jgi:hypothetical protein
MFEYKDVVKLNLNDVSALCSNNLFQVELLSAAALH